MLVLAAFGVPLTAPAIPAEAAELNKGLDAIMKSGCTTCAATPPGAVSLLANADLEKFGPGARAAQLRAAQFVADMHTTLPAIAEKLAAASPHGAQVKFSPRPPSPPPPLPSPHFSPPQVPRPTLTPFPDSNYATLAVGFTNLSSAKTPVNSVLQPLWPYGQPGVTPLGLMANWTKLYSLWVSAYLANLTKYQETLDQNYQTVMKAMIPGATASSSSASSSASYASRSASASVVADSSASAQASSASAQAAMDRTASMVAPSSQQAAPQPEGAPAPNGIATQPPPTEPATQEPARIFASDTNAVAQAMDNQQATVNAAAPTLTREQMVNMLKAATGAEPEGDDNALREKLNAILSAGVRAMAR